MKQNFQMYKLTFKDEEESEFKLPTFVGSWKKVRPIQKDIYFCFIDNVKAFDYVENNKLENP